MSGSVMRFADWGLTVDQHGGPPIYVTECTTCAEESAASNDKGDPEIWCLRHAGRTGHTGFRATSMTFFRASLIEGVR
ncbi:hypothetical protein GCM10012287_49360 [Streptomyces daqingensis]|jgi:hypothetical protein|uniref:DUF7848 domain-containing protein n=2 Tax=Streptomyces daqingensis TaxID=1472640 RepID=A0ABQ2MPV2_9ACTN|nr:hypothetical protein GCM10012287_49360 [Streptomyces daqingensis]